MANNTLFQIDAIVIDGAPVAFESGSGILKGVARFEATVVPSASGDDYQSRKRVPTTFSAKIQFGPAVDPATFTAMAEVQITARDTQGGKRALMPKCSFGSMGDVGAGGPVDITFNVLAPVQWL